MEDNMKTDRYTKIIMTVIAVALVKIAFQDIQTIEPLFAHNGNNDVHRITLCNKSGIDCITPSRGQLVLSLIHI